MALVIRIHSDVVCPWCYVGKRRLEQALRALGTEATVSWHPYQLNPGMPAEGLPRAEYRRRKFGSVERGQALDAHISGIAAGEGLAFHLDLQQRTPNTLAAHRLIWLAGRHGRQDALVEALFAAYFSAGLDVGDPAVLVPLAAAAGLDRALVTAFLAGSEGVAEVAEEEREVRAQGIQGVPLFVIEDDGGRETVNGAQPVPVFIAALTRVAVPAPAAGEDCADGLCRS